MSIMRCGGCGKPVDTDLVDCSAQEDYAFLCPDCEELAEAGLYLEHMQEMAERRY